MSQNQEPLRIYPRGEDGFRTFSIRVRSETVGKIEEIVKKTGRTRNELIGVLLEYAIDHHVIEEKK
ncbi:MAG: ribbon-helix-helix protein, CopG family [Eubacteriales bacterium]